MPAKREMKMFMRGILAAVLGAALILAPALAEARGGGGKSIGSPFMTGLMGGFLGAGLAGMIFGNSAHAMGAEGSGAGGMIGMLLQFAMIGGLAYLGFALFRRFTGANRPAEAAAGANGSARA